LGVLSTRLRYHLCSGHGKQMSIIKTLPRHSTFLLYCVLERGERTCFDSLQLSAAEKPCDNAITTPNCHTLLYTTAGDTQINFVEFSPLHLNSQRETN